MTTWGDMRKKSAGETISKEDFIRIYHDNDSAKKPLETIEEKDYKGYHYMILSFGDYPILDIRVKSPISIFSGHNLVVLKFDDGSRYELDRIFLNVNETKFLYQFNKDGDFIYGGDESGHKYSVQEVEKYAEMFIDKIIDCEKDLTNHMD